MAARDLAKTSALGRRSGRRLRVLFVLRAPNMGRFFEPLLRCLLDRGHTVDVVLEHQKRRAQQWHTTLFDSLARDYQGFRYEVLEQPRRGRRVELVRKLRLSIDYLRYLEPEFAHATALRKRARVETPRRVTRLLGRWPLTTARGRRAAGRLLRWLERSIPLADRQLRWIRARLPDVVLVSPLVRLGSAQTDHVRAAAQLRIPSVLLVASWDNLTNKGVLKDVPQRVVVWNEAQADEAVRFHRVPRERVAAVGAHSFDHWFEWSASTSREAFAAARGLRADRPILLYVCSSAFVAAAEVEFVHDWIARLRRAPHELVREAGVIVRPHPQNARPWREVALRDQAVVWPREGMAPTDAESKSEYYDSLYHAAAVIGINTSALIEAAIVGRPTLTLLDDRFRATQEGTLHFAHLAGQDGGGVLVTARSWDEHLDQLAEAIVSPDAQRARIDRFVETFVRPRGLDVPAAPVAADVIEEAADLDVEPYEATALERTIERAITLRTAAGRARRALALRTLRRRILQREPA